MRFIHTLASSESEYDSTLNRGVSLTDKRKSTQTRSIYMPAYDKTKQNWKHHTLLSPAKNVEDIGRQRRPFMANNAYEHTILHIHTNEKKKKQKQNSPPIQSIQALLAIRLFHIIPL